MTAVFPRFPGRLVLAALAFSGSAVSGTFTISPTSIAYPVTNVGAASAAQTITLNNGTAVTVTFSGAAITAPNPGDFVITAGTCGASLLAGASCTVNVAFRPTANGIRQANLQFADNAAGSPQFVTLTGTGQSPTQTLVFNPPLMTFPVTNVGLTSSQIYVAVTNYGTTGVTFNGATLVGTNPGDFSISNNGCTQLPAGPSGTCYIYLTFTPSAAGPRRATLQLNDNAPGNPYVVLLVGTGQSPLQIMNVSPLSYSYGVQDIGTTSNANYFYVQNLGNAAVAMNGISLTGTNASDFSISSNGCPGVGSPLQPNGACYVYVTFTPSASGTRSASLSIADSAPGSPQTVNVYGVGQPVTRTVAFSKSTIDLGVSTLNNTTGATYISAENTGTSSITFSNINLGGANASDFAITSNSCQNGGLSPFGYCYVYVNFTPSSTGLRSATLTFTDNATASPQVINVQGIGTAATQTLVFNYLDFAFDGLNTVGSTSATPYFQAYNAGNSPVSFNSVTLTGANAADFAITSNGCPSAGSPLNSGGYCYVYVSFTPSAPGLRTANLQYSDSATGSPQSIVLTGVAIAATQTLSFSSPSLIFAGVTVGNSAGSSYIYPTNLGDQAVTFSNVSINGPNASDFSVTSNGCTSQLIPGGICYVYVNNTPTVAGIESASLQFTDSATGSPQNIPLAGDGEPAGGVLSLNTTLVNFGSVNVGSTGTTSTNVSPYNPTGGAVVFTQQIVGPNASEYAITSNSCTGALNPNTNCNVNLNFKPTGLGPRLAALEFTTNGVAQDVLLAGVGTSASAVINLQNSVNLGLVNLGTSSVQHQLGIQNTGTLPVTFSGATITGTNASDFAIAWNVCAVLPVGQLCGINLVFTPGAAGIRTASLQIQDNATGNPHSIALYGLGQAAAKKLSTPAAVDIGSTNQGTPVSAYVNVTNGSNAAVTFTFPAISGTNASDFVVSQNNCTVLNAFNQCNVQVTFNPTGAGLRVATLQLNDDATGSPQSIIVTGVGIAPVATLIVPADLGFPATIVGTSNAQTATSQNIGTSAVNIASMTITGTNASEFILTSACSQIAPGSQCGIQVTFTPSGAGVRTANVVITSNSGGSPQTIVLFGFGQAPLVKLAMPQVVAFPTTTGGTSSSVYFNVSNVGNQTATFTSVKVVGPNAGDFTVGSWCTQIGPGGACSVQVFFSPTGANARAAAVQFTDNATGSPQYVLLTGTGQGTTHTIGLSTNTLTFGAQPVGTVSGAQFVYVYNNGTGPVTITSVTITGSNPGDYAITANTCLGNGSQLAGGANCNVAVWFTPTATGARTAMLQISDSALGNTQSVTLTGTGQ
jgi:hypothetical protein